MIHKEIKKGFTLIEILIVVVIIGILMSVVLVGVRPAQKRARDTRRIHDLLGIQAALELYNGKHGSFPAVAGWSNALVTDKDATYIPKDPQTNTDYKYVLSIDGTQYVLEATLESGTPDSDLAAQASLKAVDPNCGTSPYYCVSF